MLGRSRSRRCHDRTAAGLTAGHGRAISATLGACALLASCAQAQASATIAPLLYPDRLDARSTLDFTIHLAEGNAGVPTPLRQAVLRFPAGLTLDIPQLSSCSAARLRARGAGGCSVQSQLGRGRALLEAPVGSQTVTEDISLWVFLGPLRNLQPTVEVLGQGYTPFDERVVLSATTRAATGPYGEALTLSIPAIPTLALEPDASLVAFSLQIGLATQHRAHANAVRVPDQCPSGGFPFAADLTYADGSDTSSLATVPCPS